MGTFAKRLVKGFVASAVNQVGRDGGRVISNQLYAGNNYTPISNTNNVAPNYGSNNMSQNHIPSDAMIKTKHFSTGKMFWLVIASLLFQPIGSICVLIYGILLSIDKSAKVEWYTSERQFVQDRRYKTGVRPNGSITIKNTAKIQATPELLDVKKRNAKIAMIIGSIGLSLFILMMCFASKG